MPQVNICDATGLPIPDGTETVVGWGKLRVYGPEGMEAYEEYMENLKAASEAARNIYEDLRKEAQDLFLEVYPTGKLPDDEDEDDGNDSDN